MTTATAKPKRYSAVSVFADCIYTLLILLRPTEKETPLVDAAEAGDLSV